MPVLDDVVRTNCRVVAGERIGAQFDEEIDKSRRAISRAQCLAYLVYWPRLLEARCNSIEETELVNALCRLAEYAE
jgi:hypothetical protein